MSEGEFLSDERAIGMGKNDYPFGVKMTREGLGIVGKLLHRQGVEGWSAGTPVAAVVIVNEAQTSGEAIEPWPEIRVIATESAMHDKTWRPVTDYLVVNARCI